MKSVSYQKFTFCGNTVLFRGTMGGLGDTDSPNSEISELKSEGLVSSNLQRFASGNILGSHHSSSHIPAKLIETNYVDKGHIGAVSQKVVITNLLIPSDELSLAFQ